MSSYSQWIPFELACRLQVLINPIPLLNTRQRIANLLALARTNANGAATWARWNPTLKNGTAQPAQALQIRPASAPGYIKHPNS